MEIIKNLNIILEKERKKRKSPDNISDDDSSSDYNPNDKDNLKIFDYISEFSK